MSAGKPSASEAFDAANAEILDVRGLLCPLPVLKARKAIGRLPLGGRLLVEATDPMAAIDVPHFCNENGHTLLATERDGDLIRFLIERGR
ncbi:sulfurtransferase TusA family protein [Chthonobacter albigriseus]|uniref:sulfurtransferase TusA family protein n=1 Tax=Chthonobacter albigriseus TaxID=1683161 RepID=UPI0015EF0A41|nr:sulfurtransferase TusA family protein [Chthonobacter albigriseus]